MVGSWGEKGTAWRMFTESWWPREIKHWLKRRECKSGERKQGQKEGGEKKEEHRARRKERGNEDSRGEQKEELGKNKDKLTLSWWSVPNVASMQTAVKNKRLPIWRTRGTEKWEGLFLHPLHQYSFSRKGLFMPQAYKGTGQVEDSPVQRESRD